MENTAENTVVYLDLKNEEKLNILWILRRLSKSFVALRLRICHAIPWTVKIQINAFQGKSIDVICRY